MRPLLPYQQHAEDFFGIEKPEKGFYVNVYLREAGTEHEKMEPGNLWSNRREASVNGRAQVKGTSDKLAYRVRIKPKGPIPKRPPPEPRMISSHPFFHAPCPCMMQRMRNFR